MNTPKPIPLIKEEPEPLIRKIQEGQTYPVEALGPLRDAVEAVQGMTQAPMAIPAASALSTASLAVQGFADVETLGGSRPTSLYCLTIAKSGERKSSCDAPFMTALRNHEKEMAAERAQEFQRFQTQQAIWKAENQSILRSKKDRKKLSKTEMEADLNALGPEPTPPPSTDRTVTEPTYEGLTRLFIEGSSSLGIFSDEGGQFLGGHGMNSDNRQKTVTALNDIWGGNSIRRTRQADGSITLHGRRLAIHLMVQPAIAHEFMSDPLAVDTGFLPRFLVSEPSSTIGTRFYSNSRIDDFSVAAFGLRLRTILQTPMKMDEKTRELQPKTLRLSDEARALLIQFSDNIEAKQVKNGSLSDITGTASKCAEQAARISGVLTLWSDLDATEVTAETMKDAISLAQFYLSEALRLADEAVITKDFKQAETLRKWLLETWKEPHILPNDIVQKAPIRALRNRQATNKAIATLEDAGWLLLMDSSIMVRGKHRKEAYQIIGASGHVV
ncbi:YfjI family protein [Amylibacter sp.]|nr:YfjI family protein [Amylibacter sp.]